MEINANVHNLQLIPGTHNPEDQSVPQSVTLNYNEFIIQQIDVYPIKRWLDVIW